MKYSIVVPVLLALGLASCADQPQEPIAVSQETRKSIGSMVVPEQFSYATVSEVQFDLTSIGTRDQIIGGVVFSVLSAPRAEGGSVILTGRTDSRGRYSGSIALSATGQQMVVATDHVGLVNESLVSVQGSYAGGSFGSGSNGIDSYAGAGFALARQGGSPFTTLGTWNTSGVPQYLEPTPDVIDQGLLARITESLPERAPVPSTHPEYLDGKDKSTVLRQEADVYVTFIHEGAGYRNVLGFYTYDPSLPPRTTADIDTVRVIFPNVSFVGSGGGLRSGDKVHIGRFPAGTAIGWCVLSNGFLNSGVSPGAGIVYSTNALNPGTTAEEKQHVILLNDVGFDRVILAFEDMVRTINGSDEDFNDVIFALTTNPVTAMSTENTSPMGASNDSDGDGVSDLLDEFPQDAGKAFTVHEPSGSDFGSLAFEDLWPGIGDYDFNDLVLDYAFLKVTNARNEVVEFDATIVVRAVGAGFRNGFAIELPIAASRVASVTGTIGAGTVFPRAGNGIEAGAANAVIPFFDDAYTVMRRPGGFYVNTEANAPYVIPETLSVRVLFTSPVAMNDLGTAPYNPFIVVHGDRTHEVHLPDRAPTSKASMAFFGTYADDSKPQAGKYYRSKKGHPWALHLPVPFEYPVEYTELSGAYLKFVDWAESGGTVYKDWYGSATGYRRSNAIWKR